MSTQTLRLFLATLTAFLISKLLADTDYYAQLGVSRDADDRAVTKSEMTLDTESPNLSYVM